MHSALIKIQPWAPGRPGPVWRRQSARANALTRFIAWFRKKCQLRRAIVELRDMDDRLLADIGISRGGIEDATRRGRPSRRIPLLTDGLAAQPGAADGRE